MHFYRSFYPRDLQSLHIPSQISSAFSASALHSKWSGSQHLGCEPPLLQFIAATPQLSLFHQGHKRSDAVAKKTLRLWSILWVSQHGSSLKREHLQKISWNFRQCLAMRCFALFHPFAPLLLVFAAPIPRTRATLECHWQRKRHKISRHCLLTCCALKPIGELGCCQSRMAERIRLMHWKEVVGAVSFGVVAMVAAVTSPTTAGCSVV